MMSKRRPESRLRLRAASRIQQVEKVWFTGKTLGSVAEGREKAGSQEPQECLQSRALGA